MLVGDETEEGFPVGLRAADRLPHPVVQGEPVARDQQRPLVCRNNFTDLVCSTLQCGESGLDPRWHLTILGGAAAADGRKIEPQAEAPIRSWLKDGKPLWLLPVRVAERYLFLHQQVDRRTTFVVVSTLETAPVREAEFFIRYLAQEAGLQVNAIPDLNATIAYGLGLPVDKVITRYGSFSSCRTSSASFTSFSSSSHDCSGRVNFTISTFSN